MKIKQKMKHLKVKGKLNLYRTFMVGIISLMGIISIILTIIINLKIKSITEVWSPSLALVQELDSLTSDYRIKQYGHLVSTTNDEMTRYENEMAEIDSQITEKSDEFQKIISTDTEKQLYKDVLAKWTDYKTKSEEIIEMSRSNINREKAGELMVGEVYDVYKDFSDDYDQLMNYAQNELDLAKQVISYVVIITFVVIVAAVAVAVVVANKLGKMVTDIIVEPVEQIAQAADGMYNGDLSVGKLITYESDDELGATGKKLSGAMVILSDYIDEISLNLKEIAKGDLTKNSAEITDFRGDFSSIKESLVYILKHFNSTLTEIQNTSDHVASDAGEIAEASHSLSEGATDQASAVQELTATIETVSNLAVSSAKSTQEAYDNIKISADRAEREKEKMAELTEEMKKITEISRQIENIITAIEDIAAQTNLLALNASIEAARAGDAGKGFAVVADQIGKLAADSAKSAVDTRELIQKTLEEIENGNAITQSTSDAFDNVIEEMKKFAGVAQEINENVKSQAEALDQIEEGIEQISGVVQNVAASSEENSAISDNLSDKAHILDELVKKFKLF